jgi:hypothetical protein
MGIRRGSISTPIIADGLVFNVDAANRASTVQNPNIQSTQDTISGATGTFSTKPIWNNDEISPSFLSDGSDSRIIMSSLTPYSSDDPHTYSAWINYDVGTSYKWILNNGNLHEGDSLILFSNRIGYFWNGGNAVKKGTITLNPDTWYNFTVCYHGSSLTYDMYVNGVLDTSSDTSSPTAGSGTTWTATNSNPSIASWYNGNYDFQGNIACVHVYNRSLSANEVLHNYNALKSRFGL